MKRPCSWRSRLQRGNWRFPREVRNQNLDGREDRVQVFDIRLSLANSWYGFEIPHGCFIIIRLAPTSAQLPALFDFHGIEIAYANPPRSAAILYSVLDKQTIPCFRA